MIQNIPHEWYDGPRYFFSYYGDVYHGFVFTCFECEDRFYIVSKNSLKEWNELKGENRNCENFNKLAWEIFDPSVIVHTIKGDFNSKIGGKVKSHQHNRIGNTPYKRMIIFGAGASSFCTFKEDNQQLRASKLRPPLGNEVFHEDYDDYCNKYPGVSLSLPAYEAANNDIEAFIEVEWKQIRKRKRIDLLIRHINVQHYLQHLLKDVSENVINNFNRRNLYSLLAGKLKNYYSEHPEEKLAIVSFNYDTILDHYLERHFGKAFKKMEDYIDYNKPYLYFKPHGSINWGWRYNTNYAQLTRKGERGRNIYDHSLNLFDLYFDSLGGVKINLAEDSWGAEMFLNKDLKGRLTINKDRIQVIDKDYEYYPALLIPHQDKDEFVMPYYHQSSLKFVAHDVEELYLIGWKGSEDVFNRFINARLDKLKKIVIVNPNEKETGEITAILRNYDKFSKAKIEIVHDFETFVKDEFDNYFKS